MKSCSFRELKNGYSSGELRETEALIYDAKAKSMTRAMKMYRNACCHSKNASSFFNMQFNKNCLL